MTTLAVMSVKNTRFMMYVIINKPYTQEEDLLFQLQVAKTKRKNVTISLTSLVGLTSATVLVGLRVLHNE